MQVFLNGQFLPEERAVVPVTDRGFLYGDGLYETMAFYGCVPFRWDAHLQRLEDGLKLLRIELPFRPSELKNCATRLVEINNVRDTVLRLTVSRGSGRRGYSIKDATKPVVVMTLHALPQKVWTGWRLITSSFRVLAGDPLVQIKTASKVRSVLARAEAEDRGADEALLLNERGEITEGAATNFFWIEGAEPGVVCTPPLAGGILPGVTRAIVLEICARLGIETAERSITPEDAKRAQSAFVTVSTMGIVEVLSLDESPIRKTPVVEKIITAYWSLVAEETRSGRHQQFCG